MARTDAQEVPEGPAVGRALQKVRGRRGHGYTLSFCTLAGGDTHVPHPGTFFCKTGVQGDEP